MQYDLQKIAASYQFDIFVTVGKFMAEQAPDEIHKDEIKGELHSVFPEYDLTYIDHSLTIALANLIKSGYIVQVSKDTYRIAYEIPASKEYATEVTNYIKRFLQS